MTNSGIITKVEYAILPSTTMIDIDAIPFSGNFSEKFAKTMAGVHYEANADFSIAKIETATNEMLQALVDRKAIFNITDGNGTVHVVGTNIYPARLAYSRAVDAQAGGFNGYRCNITRVSPTPCEIEVNENLLPESSS